MSKHAPGHRARKRFGQHFLRDQTVIDRIVAAIAPQTDEPIIEIGPGEGVLTGPLLESGAKLTAVELDRDLTAHLRQQFPSLDVVNTDAVKADLAEIAGQRRFKLVGNLPYNVSTPILFHALDNAALVERMVFMLQREVIDRMVAQPGSKTYGRLSVMLQYRCDMSRLFTVPPGAFAPPPKVQSAVVAMIPKEPRVRANDHGRFEAVVKAAFAKRRKTIANALKELLPASAIEATGVAPTARAEQLDVADFVAMANQPTGT